MSAEGYYRNIHTGELVPAELWEDYCMEQCGLLGIDDTAPLAAEFRTMLCEWVASGAWIGEEHGA